MSSKRHSPHDVLAQIADDFLARDVARHTADDRPHDGRTIGLKGRPLVHFGSCSYMGLEVHPALKAGVQTATERFGTQFSSSRAFLSVALYEALEERLSAIFQRPLMVSATTTLGHLAALPTLVEAGDAVIMDLQVHHSVQTAAELLKPRGVPIHIVRHNDLNQLEHKVRHLRGRHRRIWYLADGVYSMFGDFAPVNALRELMDRYPALHCYIDDAHGTSWAGERGSGVVRSLAPHHDKMVLAVSLNKAFAAAGGAIVFPNEAMRERARNCGGAMIFSGPIQPPMLGAAIASAELHLSDELPAMQQELLGLIDHTNERLRQLGLPQYQETRSPLFFIPMGLPKVVANMVHRVLDDGFYVNMATFPATPMRQGGLRFMLHRNLRRADVDSLLERVAHHYPRALHEEGSSARAVATAFDLPEFSPDRFPTPADSGTAPLVVERSRSIHEVDAALWDGFFGEAGNTTHRGLVQLERVFADAERDEDRWRFDYLLVRDDAGDVVLATFFTTALVKDDMTAAARVSRQVEAQRAQDPHYLTSTAVMLGSLISRGEHLHLDREHPRWRDALGLLLEALQERFEEAEAQQIVLREFPAGNDDELRQVFLDEGFVAVPLGDALGIDDLGWSDRSSYHGRLSSRYRYNLKREILAFEDRFEIVSDKPEGSQEIDEVYELYRQVHSRAFELNVFPLPRSFFAMACADPSYDLLRLYLRDDPRPPLQRTPLAVMVSYVAGGTYAALVVGLDDAFIRTHNTYKQALYQTVLRAHELGCARLDLAYTADLEKKKVGAWPTPMVAFAQTRDGYRHALLESLSIDCEDPCLSPSSPTSSPQPATGARANQTSSPTAGWKTESASMAS